MKKIIVYLVFSLSLIAFGEGVKSLGFTPDKVRPDNVAVYSIEFIDFAPSFNVNDLPLPDDLSIVGTSQSRSMSFGTQGSKSSLKYDISMSANKEGTYTIPEWALEYKGKKYSVKASTLTVDKNAVSTSNRQINNVIRRSTINNAQAKQQHTQAPLDSYIKVQINLDSEKIYVGQAVPCKLVISIDKTLVENGFELVQLVPQIKKADDFECQNFNKEPILDTQTSKTHAYLTFNTVITPIKVGTYDLDFSINGIFNKRVSIDEIMGMSMIDRMMSMDMNRSIPFEIDIPAEKVDVMALPSADKPKDFSGAIGKFTLQSEKISPDVLSVGEPCSLIIKVLGMGNFNRMNAPEIENNKNWKSYKPKSSFIDESESMAYIGIKTFDYTLVPNVADLKVSPKVVFTYFDPFAEKYVSLEAKQSSVDVAPTARSFKKENAIVAKDNEIVLDEIMQNSSKNNIFELFGSWYFILSQVLIIALVIIVLWRRSITLKLLKDPKYAKLISSRKAVMLNLKKSKFASSHKNLNDFLSYAKLALQNAIAAKTNLESLAILKKEALEILNENAFDETDISKITIIFEGLDAINFGGMRHSDIDLNDLNLVLNKICKKLIK